MFILAMLLVLIALYVSASIHDYFLVLVPAKICLELPELLSVFFVYSQIIIT